MIDGTVCVNLGSREPLYGQSFHSHGVRKHVAEYNISGHRTSLLGDLRVIS
jgi:hypothetical protein